MRKTRPLSCIGFLLAAVTACTQNETMPPAPLLPVPTEAQLAWHAMERNAFVHYTINTYTGKEWGFGDEKESLLNPDALDASQWAKTLKAGGFRGVILTCKHHDGFCLWPSKFTEHSVKNSPWKNGKGDLVKDLSAAVRAQGMKFGIYVSPWDRNRADYGTPAYVAAYRNQLKELFENYGPMFEMWFDGANGGDGYYGGAREKRTIAGASYYDWPATLELVRTMEPNVIFFSDAGPGVRWVGNERGEAGLTNWNTISPDTLYAGKAGIEALLNTGNKNGTNWIPAEVDVSIRPGWFYHESEDSLVKSPERLFEIYLSSVGRGSTLLLNVPPDKHGRIHAKDSAVLVAWNAMIRNEFKNNLAANRPAGSDSHRGNAKTFHATNVTDENPDTYWSTDDGITTGVVDIDLVKPQSVKYIVLEEHIKLGQRVTAFAIEAKTDGHWNTVASGTTVGYKRIVKISSVEADAIRIKITGSRACPLISEVRIY